MKIGFDIGGVLSKYVGEFTILINDLDNSCADLFIITDQHPKNEVLKTLKENGFLNFIKEENVYCADYAKYGNMAKALLIKQLGLDIFIDDFEPYLVWDSSLGPQPILLKVMPDVYKPYHAKTWKQPNYHPFGSAVYDRFSSLNKEELSVLKAEINGRMEVLDLLEKSKSWKLTDEEVEELNQ